MDSHDLHRRRCRYGVLMNYQFWVYVFLCLAWTIIAYRFRKTGVRFRKLGVSVPPLVFVALGLYDAVMAYQTY